MENSFHPIRLQGDHCTLVPLSFEHHDELIEAVTDGELDKLWYALVPEPTKMKENIRMRLNRQQQGIMIPFAVIDRLTKKAIGMTSYWNIDRENRRVEIGGTWYRKSAQRTGINTECKLLLLTHAFEMMNCIAVEFRTHAFNYRSRQGIERLGAKLDGIIRNHMIMPNGTLRDTFVYSIISNEWATVKAHLEFLKNKYLTNG
ncbi:GNAT family N-acetyltransferase [Legionella brunensis]|uniref:GNAT family acetyltransferase n=1 Tax=Legionella brunensis TaxID=29422 RepID=A0A0W0SNX4_9GAMM|nr:GNAT family protein [Legionella brunensis]KTC84956.1 GNAT family acetyltransferase [Legionella brunensis]